VSQIFRHLLASTDCVLRVPFTARFLQNTQHVTRRKKICGEKPKTLTNLQLTQRSERGVENRRPFLISPHAFQRVSNKHRVKFQLDKNWSLEK
jgi:hypothetical protein